MGVVELGKVVQGGGCVCVVWAKDFLTDCQGPLVERLS